MKVFENHHVEVRETLGQDYPPSDTVCRAFQFSLLLIEHFTTAENNVIKLKLLVPGGVFNLIHSLEFIIEASWDILLI